MKKGPLRAFFSIRGCILNGVSVLREEVAFLVEVQLDIV